MADTDRLDEIKARVALRHHNSEDHSPIDVHKTIDGFVTPELQHRLCIECSDVDTVEALENGDLIDSADGVVYPCAAADVDWLVAEIERLRGRLEKPCGSCHPCMNYRDETWRAADRKPPHVFEYDQLVAEVKNLRDQSRCPCREEGIL